jgi:hypothetical protein
VHLRRQHTPENALRPLHICFDIELMGGSSCVRHRRRESALRFDLEATTCASCSQV